MPQTRKPSITATARSYARLHPSFGRRRRSCNTKQAATNIVAVSPSSPLGATDNSPHKSPPASDANATFDGAWETDSSHSQSQSPTESSWSDTVSLRGFEIVCASYKRSRQQAASKVDIAFPRMSISQRSTSTTSLLSQSIARSFPENLDSSPETTAPMPSVHSMPNLTRPRVGSNGGDGSTTSDATAVLDLIVNGHAPVLSESEVTDSIISRELGSLCSAIVRERSVWRTYMGRGEGSNRRSRRQNTDKAGGREDPYGYKPW